MTAGVCVVQTWLALPPAAGSGQVAPAVAGSSGAWKPLSTSSRTLSSPLPALLVFAPMEMLYQTFEPG